LGGLMSIKWFYQRRDGDVGGKRDVQPGRWRGEDGRWPRTEGWGKGRQSRTSRSRGGRSRR
jgi:hypothetical protein